MMGVPFETDRRPVVLVWEVTRACELACHHCRVDAKPAPHPDELTTREGKSLLERVRAFGDDQLIVLSRGDPLARDDLIDLVPHRPLAPDDADAERDRPALPGAVAYTRVQVAAWAVVNAGAYTAIGYADKAVQVALVGVLVVLVRRR